VRREAECGKGVAVAKNYPEYHKHLESLIGQLGRRIPDTMTGFAEMHRHSVSDGALTARVKELIALAISIAVRCDGCIAYHVHDALKAGATDEEVCETIGVAVMMGGGPGSRSRSRSL
jgi:AhpD family alkylhydroperoxidase